MKTRSLPVLAGILLFPCLAVAQVSVQGAARPSNAGATATTTRDVIHTTVGGVAATFHPADLSGTGVEALNHGLTIGQVELAGPIDRTPRGTYDLVVTRGGSGYTAHLSSRGRPVMQMRYFAVNLKPDAPPASGPSYHVCQLGCRTALPDKSGITFSPAVVASSKQSYFDTVTVVATVLGRDGNPVSNAGVQFSLFDQAGSGFGSPTPSTTEVELLPSQPGTARVVIKKYPIYLWLQARVGNLFATVPIDGYSPPSSGSSSSSSSSGSNCSTAFGWGSTFCWW